MNNNSNLLNNEYIVTGLLIFIVVYCASITSEVNNIFLKMFDNILFQIFIVYIIFLTFDSYPSLSIMLTLALILSLQMNKKKRENNIFGDFVLNGKCTRERFNNMVEEEMTKIMSEEINKPEEQRRTSDELRQIAEQNIEQTILFPNLILNSDESKLSDETEEPIVDNKVNSENIIEKTDKIYDNVTPYNKSNYSSTEIVEESDYPKIDNIPVPANTIQESNVVPIRNIKQESAVFTLPPYISSNQSNLLPVSVTQESAVVPVSVTQESAVVPVSVTQESAVVPVSVTQESAVVPVSVTKESAVVPVSVTQESAVVPVSVAKDSSVVPVSVAQDSSVVPVSVAQDSSVVPVTQESAVIPVTQDSSVVPVTQEPTVKKPTVVSKKNIPRGNNGDYYASIKNLGQISASPLESQIRDVVKSNTVKTKGARGLEKISKCYACNKSVASNNIVNGYDGNQLSKI